MTLAPLLFTVFGCFLLFAGLMLVLRFTLPPKDAEARLKLSLVAIGAWMIATALFSYFGLLDWTTRPGLATTVLIFPIAAALILAATTPGSMQKRMPLGLLLIVQSLRALPGMALLLFGFSGNPILAKIGGLELALGVAALVVWVMAYRQHKLGLSALQAWYGFATLTALGSFTLLGLLQSGRAFAIEPELLAFPGIWLLTFLYPAFVWLLLMGSLKAFRHSQSFDTERHHDPGN